MRQPISTRICFVFFLVTLVVNGSDAANGQGRYEVTTGFWIPFLPSYELANQFETPLADRLDDPCNLGGQIGLQGMYRFAPTRTMLEFDLNLAYADRVTSISVSQLSSTESVDGDILHHSQYIGLRDRFDMSGWGLGLLDLGCGFSHLRYDQDLTTRTEPIGFRLDESIDNDYRGGELRSSMTCMMRNRPVTLDFNLGLFDLDGRMRSALGNDLGPGTGVVPVGEASPNVDKTAFTIDIGLKWQTSICGVPAKSGVSLKYLSDMATITHPAVVTLINYDGVGSRTEAAYFLSWNLELLL